MKHALKQLMSLIANDVRLQFRQGFYYSYIFITVLYILVLNVLQPKIRDFLLPILIFSDPAMLGFFFIGGLLLLEKAERNLESLFTSPSSIHHYLLAKVISLGLISFVAGIGISFGSGGVVSLSGREQPLLVGGFSAADVILFSASLILTSACFTLFGFLAACRFDTVNRYLLGSTVFFLPLFIPILSYFGITEFFLFPYTPTLAGLNLPYRSLASQKESNTIISLIVLILWTGIAYFWAYRWFDRFIRKRIL